MAEEIKQWGALGDILFSASSSPRRIAAKRSTDYAQINRLSQKPLLQNVGDKLDKLTFSFILNAGWIDPSAALAEIQAAMADKQPMFLEFGNGQFAEYYVIESLSSNVSETLPTGEILTLSLTVELLETVDRPADDQPLVLNPFVEVRSA